MFKPLPRQPFDLRLRSSAFKNLPSILVGLIVTLALLAGAASASDTRIQLRMPASPLHVGTIEFEASIIQRPESTDARVEQVKFELDGEVVVQRRTAPYTASIFLGRLPSERRVVAIALDTDGNELARDEVLLNRRRNVFTVAIAKPLTDDNELDPPASGLNVELDVNTPPDAQLDRVELFLNDTKVHTFRSPPFRTQLAQAPATQSSFLRAEAFLSDGNSTEDIAFLRQANAVDSVEVQYVQLYLSVREKRSNRSVLDLEREDLAISEDGKPQELRRFERVNDLPLNLAVLLDVSASMAPRMEQSLSAARTFFSTTMRPKDRATLIAFNDRPSLLVDFTANAERLARGLEGTRAIKGTALYDSLVFALYQLAGIKGQRAVLLLSDGSDESSALRYSDALEYTRRSGIPIYAVRIEQGRAAKRARAELEELTSTSGGRVFFIASAAELDDAYQAIALELRSRFLATYQSSQSGSTNPQERRFREIEVEVDRRGVEVSTLRGYYP